ncbi:lipase family alpha/beta hydrolase [Amycolatopsis australiensis]|uniref:Triacylglycerol esterase/lipase EstA, alpha/beta hydrolase fold n=1 Tax=Amycolatopsis australiensis TaxID=546364 RepID=A0A1K1T6E5_9PSEU|nr:lipase [Amycolatopsis australiensis]SFW92193.1 Triacylglycerol esterase/lipase EstA, alpha/beta hydrolase fold [Amycolatopsis australiensis]
MRITAWWRGISPRRRLLLSGAGAAVVTVLVAAVAATTGTSAAPRTGVPDQSRPGPVLLVPGYGGGQGGLDVLAARIRQATGRSTEVLTLAGDGTGDLLEQAGVLAEAVERAYARGAPSVDVVGYSAGGVVARLWVSREGGDHQARRVVTLGAPMHGTGLAAAGTALDPGACPVACRQLAPGSSLLQELAKEPIPATLPWLSVWTERDETVTPPDSARLDGAVNVALQQVCPGNQARHGDLPTDPAVTALVLQALGTTPLEAPAGCLSS